MPEIIMTKGGTQRGDRPLAYVPYEKRNGKERCPKCKYSTEVKDEYRRFFGWMCTIDRDMNAEECDCYAACGR